MTKSNKENERIFISVPVILSVAEFEKLLHAARNFTNSNVGWVIRDRMGMQAIPRFYKSSADSRAIISSAKYLTERNRKE